jgi:excinuclease ABC subunit C
MSIDTAKLPDAPGVYFFLGEDKKILYIGKATSLRDRVRSYFAKDLAAARGGLIVQMVAEVKGVDHCQTDSVLEALILEANLIRKHRPKYNTREKDNKSFNHVVITDEPYPRVLVVRGRDLELLEAGEDFRRSRTVPKGIKIKRSFGPFPSGSQLKDAMKIIRRMFPFRGNRCVPESGNPCFDAQIGLCPGVCTQAMSKEDYRKQMRNITLFFDGKKKELVRTLERDMKTYAKRQEFEQAAQARKTLFALNHIQDIALLKRDVIRDKTREQVFRIEAYDIAHLSGKNMVGSMVVIENGEPNKAEYRKFKIRTLSGSDDPGALREVLTRRLGHAEWPLPQLVVVDGGIAQKNAAEAVLAERGFSIEIVAVTKDEHHRPRELVGEMGAIKRREPEILLANSEAHRFAIAYHRNLRKKW